MDFLGEASHHIMMMVQVWEQMIQCHCHNHAVLQAETQMAEGLNGYTLHMQNPAIMLAGDTAHL